MAVTKAPSSTDSAASGLADLLANARVELSLAVRAHTGSTVSEATEHSVTEFPSRGELSLNGATWEMKVATTPSQSAPWHLHFSARCSRGPSPATTVGFNFAFPDWSRENYVVIPGAVYDGNRQPTVPDLYPPLPRPTQPRPEQLQYASIPQLNPGEGRSRLEQLSTDGSIPGIGLFFPDRKTGLWLLTPDTVEGKPLSLELEEFDGRALLRIHLPGLRHETAYAACNADAPSTETAPDFLESTAIEATFALHLFACEDIPELFEKLLPLRRAALPPPSRANLLPFSAAWNLMAEKYHRENWVPFSSGQSGYFSVGVDPMRSRHITQDWQPGWTGGGISSYALAAGGSDQSLERALLNLDFLIGPAQAPSGFFYGMGNSAGRFAGDHFSDEQAPWHLVRKSGDVLFYSLRLLELLDARGQGSRIKPEWLDGLRRCADAFVTLWDEAGEFGQFVDHDTGKLIVGGSTSGGIVPAALLLAARRFSGRAEDYRRVALAAAEQFDREHLACGLTTGGPGDAAQVPDSESAAGLLESLVALYENSGDKKWLSAARRCAAQAASWVVPYDFPFPAESTFGKLDMRTNGTVMANAQNKHSAPGICTHSGQSFFRLFRATGERLWLDLAAEIAHALPQYISRADRPIAFKIPYNAPEHPSETTLRPGWICERVNITQWGPSEQIGEVFYYSCWPEVSLLLSIVELPGVYAQPDTGLCVAFDHVTAEWTDHSGERALLLRNPTDFGAEVTVLVETSAQALTAPLAVNARDQWKRIQIEAGGEALFSI